MQTDVQENTWRLLEEENRAATQVLLSSQGWEEP